jgi:hypothetical protein
MCRLSWRKVNRLQEVELDVVLEKKGTLEWLARPTYSQPTPCLATWPFTCAVCVTAKLVKLPWAPQIAGMCVQAQKRSRETIFCTASKMGGSDRWIWRTVNTQYSTAAWLQYSQQSKAYDKS